MREPAASGSRERVSREAWLRAALELVAHEGGGGLRIDDLAKKMKVTKGSFYHHFKDRQDFIEQMVDYWVQRFNHYVIENIQYLAGPAEDRLLSLMRLLKREGLDLYDITFRAWAAQDEWIAKKVRDVDLARYDFIKALFKEMGFTGDELEVRTRIWLVVASAHSTVNFPEPDALEGQFFEMSHSVFVQKTTQ